MPAPTGRFRRWATSLVHRRLARKLRSLDSETLARASERGAINRYCKVAPRVPAYRAILGSRLGELRPGMTIAQFRELVPIIDKSIFERFALENLVPDGAWEKIESIYTSSGSSGVFSFNAQARGSQQALAELLEFRLDLVFNVGRRKTLLVNCLPVGITIPTRTLPVVQCGTREDSIRFLVGRLAGSYEQLIFIGEPLFLKRVFEVLHRAGSIPRGRAVSAITGAEYMPESFREYLGAVAGFDFENPENGMLYFSMGASELGLSILFEDESTFRLRRLLDRSPEARHALMPGDTGLSTPHVMQYVPTLSFLETTANDELVVSNLGADSMVPLMRYNTRDQASLKTWREVSDALAARDLGAFSPALKLPLCFFRGKKFSGRIDPNQVKARLYKDAGIAARVTGNFRIIEGVDRSEILFQLSEDENVGASIRERFEEDLRASLRAPGAIAFQWIAYLDFRYSMSLNYQRKVAYQEGGPPVAGS
jgi:phenylacetate-CoA ligase